MAAVDRGLHQKQPARYAASGLIVFNLTVYRALKGSARGAFPSEDAALKVMYLALRNLAGRWHTVQNWKEALNRFHILWPERMPALERG